MLKYFKEAFSVSHFLQNKLKSFSFKTFVSSRKQPWRKNIKERKSKLKIFKADCFSSEFFLRPLSVTWVTLCTGALILGFKPRIICFVYYYGPEGGLVVSRVGLGSRDLVFNSCYQQTFSRELCPYQNYSVSVHSDNNGGQGILVAAMLLKKASISL